MIYRISCLLIAFGLFCGFTFRGQVAASAGYKQEFYAALASEEKSVLEKELAKLASINAKEKDAYTGTLKMKLAGLLSGPGEKLNAFKAGHALLEAAIKKEPANAEYAYLRLVIQENAPAILRYSGQVEQDAALVKRQYASLEPVVRESVKDYSLKKSKALKASDLR